MTIDQTMRLFFKFPMYNLYRVLYKRWKITLSNVLLSINDWTLGNQSFNITTKSAFKLHVVGSSQISRHRVCFQQLQWHSLIMHDLKHCDDYWMWKDSLQHSDVAPEAFLTICVCVFMSIIPRNRASRVFAFPQA